MPVLRFHLLTIDHEMVEGGFTVTITTNAACHLYLRYSGVFPRIHRKSVARRGLVMGWDARYCFVAYQHLEQDEAGDTFTHTFTWPGWENCNTRYFYFWGTMGGQDMVSDTPIFWLHYLWIPPPEPTIRDYNDIWYSLLFRTFMDDQWEANDWLPSATYTLTLVKFWICKRLNAKLPHVLLFDADDVGMPIGSPIFDQTFSWAGISEWPDFTLAEVSVPPTAIVEGERRSICLRCSGPYQAKGYGRWHRGTFEPINQSAHHYSSFDQGATWAGHIYPYCTHMQLWGY